jgi:hypothetical protein
MIDAPPAFTTTEIVIVLIFVRLLSGCDAGDATIDELCSKCAVRETCNYITLVYCEKIIIWQKAMESKRSKDLSSI